MSHSGERRLMGLRHSCVVRDLSWFRLSCLNLLGRLLFYSLTSDRQPLPEVCSWPFLEFVGLGASGSELLIPRNFLFDMASPCGFEDRCLGEQESLSQEGYRVTKRTPELMPGEVERAPGLCSLLGYRPLQINS